MIQSVFISIVAPTRGATKANRVPPYRKENFNPLSHEGSDTLAEAERRQQAYFNPRSHEGSD